jgi:hypothetical protein
MFDVTKARHYTYMHRVKTGFWFYMDIFRINKTIKYVNRKEQRKFIYVHKEDIHNQPIILFYNYYKILGYDVRLLYDYSSFCNKLFIAW